ncbi:MAG: hypothetical protein N3G79_06170 [Sulfolobales archaeon]|nr:hypothetical protein [Sulfolobales archaeon]
MSRRVAVAICAAVAIAITTLALAPILEVRIRGVVEVPSALKVVEIKIAINRESGSEEVHLGEIKIPRGEVVARVKLVSREGEFSTVISGLLVLRSGNRSYEIPMPCAISIGEPCYRIMVLIPGYDTPMPVEEDTYEAILKLEWVARGSGRFDARLYLEKAA